MATGTVKWFNNQKGYGFICLPETNEEVFAHFSSIAMEGYKTLKAGQAVEFEINQGPKGLHALNIQPGEAPQDEYAYSEDEELVPEEYKEHAL